MSPVIRITDELYSRLEQHASGFDTPDQVIRRALDYFEANTPESTPLPVIHSKPDPKPATMLEISFKPINQEVFLKKFLESKVAYVRIHYTDGTIVDKVWRGKRLTKDSSLEGNLRSGYLRGWKKKGICKAEISLKPFK